MFRALTCPFSGGKIVFTQHLVSSLSVKVCTAHWLRADSALNQCSMQAQRGSGGISPPILNLGARSGGSSTSCLGRHILGKDPVSIVPEASWASRRVWAGTENLDSTGIWSPDRGRDSELIYLLRYPARTSFIPYRKRFISALFVNKIFAMYGV